MNSLLLKQAVHSQKQNKQNKNVMPGALNLLHVTLRVALLLHYSDLY